MKTFLTFKDFFENIWGHCNHYDVNTHRMTSAEIKLCIGMFSIHMYKSCLSEMKNQFVNPYAVCITRASLKEVTCSVLGDNDARWVVVHS